MRNPTVVEDVIIWRVVAMGFEKENHNGHTESKLECWNTVQWVITTYSTRD